MPPTRHRPRGSSGFPGAIALAVLMQMMLCLPLMARDQRLLEHVWETKDISVADISPDNRVLAVYSGGSREVQLWEWQTKKVVSKLVLNPRQPAEEPGNRIRMDHPEPFLKYARTGAKLIFYNDGRIVVLNPTTLETLREIDLQTEANSWPPPRVDKDTYAASYVADVEVDSAGRRAAALVRFPGYEGGELRVYDLEAGVLLRSWRFESSISDVMKLRRLRLDLIERPIAIDASGQYVAVSLAELRLGNRPDVRQLSAPQGDILVLDVNTGQSKAAIRTGSTLGDAIAFSPEGGLSLVAVPMDAGIGKRNGAIRFWNAGTGELMREIQAPRGARGFLEVSQDGRTVLTYVLDVKKKFYWAGVESGDAIAHRKLVLLDAKTGKTVAASPDFWPGQWVSHPHLRLSPKGDFTLACRSMAPLYLFELP